MRPNKPVNRYSRLLWRCDTRAEAQFTLHSINLGSKFNVLFAYVLFRATGAFISNLFTMSAGLFFLEDAQWLLIFHTEGFYLTHCSITYSMFSLPDGLQHLLFQVMVILSAVSKATGLVSVP